MMLLKLLLWLYVTVNVCSTRAAADDTERRFNVSLVSSNSTPRVLAAVQSAVDQLNSNPALNFTLELISRHSQCDHRDAQRVFYESLVRQPDLLAVVGATCSEASIGVAEVATFYKIPMLSYSSTSVELGVREEFPSFLRTVPSDASLTVGVATLIATYPEWNRVVVLTQDTEQYKLGSAELVQELECDNVTVTVSLLLPSGLNRSAGSDPLWPPNNRIFVLNMDPAQAVFVLCEAIERGLGEYEYVWVLQGWYTEDWWRNTDDVQCNATSLASFLQRQRAVTVGYYPPSLEDTPADLTGTVVSSVTSSVQSSAPYAYDAVLSLALAINQTLEELDTYSIQLLRERLLTNLNQLNPFQGLSGIVELVNGTRAVDSLTVHQYRDCNDSTCYKAVGVVSVSGGGDNRSVRFLPGESREGLWEGTVPSDGTPIVQENFPYLWLTISSYVFASLVILGAIGSMIFTVIFMKRKLVRLTSPNLNLVIALGVIMFNSSVFMFVYPPVSQSVLEVFCALRVWLVSVGVSLCFGTVNAKMWRIYYIFHNPNPARRKRPLKDWHLLLIVLSFVLVDVIILTPVSILSNSRLAPRSVPDPEHSSFVNENGISVNPVVTLCESDTRVFWLILVFGYKAVIQAIGLFLAMRIRNIKIKVLNDSKEIAATLYLSSAILAVVVVVSVALDDRLNVYSACYCYGIPLSTSVVLIVVFFSKMVRLYKDPNGELIFTHHAPTNATLTSPVVVSNQPAHFNNKTIDLSDDKVQSLEKQVKALTLQLSKYPHQECTGSGDHVLLNETAVTVLDHSTLTVECSSGSEEGGTN